MARPATPHSQELAEVICERLADGETLKAICRGEGMPDDRTVRRWALEDVEGFAEKYERARLVGYLRMADDILDLADDKSGDVIVDGEGIRRPDHAAVQRSRLQIDSRKWLMSKALPKIYGDRVHTDIDHTVHLGAERKSPLELARAIAFVLALGRRQAAALAAEDVSVTHLDDYRHKEKAQ